MLQSASSTFSRVLALDEFRIFGSRASHQQLTPIARTWSAYWQDRDKARAFVAEAERMLAIYQEEEYELEAQGAAQFEGYGQGDY